MKILRVDRIANIDKKSRFLLDIDNDPFDGIKSTIVILNEKDLHNETIINKLKGTSIDILMIPKSLVDIYYTLPVFKIIEPCLISDSNVMFF